MITICLICLVLYLIFRPKESLEKRFDKLGDVEGMAYEDIRRKLGEPNSMSRIGSDKVLCTWSRLGFSISLLFDDHTDRCIRVERRAKTF